MSKTANLNRYSRLTLSFLIGVGLSSVVGFHLAGLGIVLLGIAFFNLSMNVLLGEPRWDSRGSERYTKSVLFWPTFRVFVLSIVIVSATAGTRALLGYDPRPAAEMTILLIAAMPIACLFAYSGISLYAGERYATMSVSAQWMSIAASLVWLNVIAVVVIYAFRAIILERLKVVAQSSFISQHHFIIFFLLSIILVGIGMGFAISRERLSWELLERLKGISIFSPMYCLGGGVFGKKTLSSLNIPAKDSNILVGTFVVCGILFLLFLLTFALLRPSQNITESDSSEGDVKNIVDEHGNPIASDNTNREQPDMTRSLFFVSLNAGLAITLLLSTVIDFSFLVMVQL